MKVLDSDLLVAILRKDPSVDKRIDTLMTSGEPMATTIFNAHEVMLGAMVSAKSAQNCISAKRLLDSMNIIDYDMDCMVKTVSLKTLLIRKGTPIGLFDEMIAGICLANNATIVTRNVDHFSKIPDLTVEIW